ncbi:MAG: hypothetical protein Q8Q25_02440 [bacterium]|nr:hypothetical protein [bacterium]
MSTNKPFAEVIESSLHGLLAQSWQWDYFPPFGSLIIIEGLHRTLFGIVYQVQTGSMDPVRYPFAYQKTEQELLKEQPQIFEFLKTTFSCLILGYQEKGKLFYLLAPEPPKIHSFITPASIELSKRFFNRANYLHLLFGFSHLVGNLDELLLAILKHKTELNILTEEKLHQFIQTYSLLTGNDYRRIKLFLQRAQHVANYGKEI